MKLAIVCANIGSIDAVHGLPRQNLDYDYYYYNETNLPFPLPNLNNRMKSKYIKIMMHRFLPDYDAYIWIDGKVKVLTNNFAELMIKGLTGVNIFRHQQRSRPIDELDFIIGNMKSGSKYLLERYGDQSLEKEREYYMKSPRTKLFETTTFARLNNKEMNEKFTEWWLRTVEFSCFDQAMFSYIVFPGNVKQLLRGDFEKVFEVVKHIR